jgi:hypothetical protein
LENYWAIIKFKVINHWYCLCKNPIILGLVDHSEVKGKALDSGAGKKLDAHCLK